MSYIQSLEKELDIVVQPINISIQKINNTTLKIYKMILLAFLRTDQNKKIKFFEKLFL